MTVPPETVARESPEGVKMETTAEERNDWQLRGGAGGPDAVRRLIRDVATLFAEVARLGAQLQIANSEIVRLSASREEMREQLESEVARLKAELVDTAAKEHENGWNEGFTDGYGEAFELYAPREATVRAEEREAMAVLFDAESKAHESNDRHWAYKRAAAMCRTRNTP